MSHIHAVKDSDTNFKINPITRQVKNESSRKTTLIQYDHNSERFTFEIPRYVEFHDMALCNKAEIHYINIDQKTKEEKRGTYQVDDLRVEEDDSAAVVCSWLISNNATQYAGRLSFIVRYSCVENGKTVYAWNSAPASVDVSSGIDSGDYVVTEYADVLERWKAELFNAGYINAATMQTEIKVLSARMDNFAKLPNGSTTADAELIDMRIGANGETYETAGEAVREQITAVDSRIEKRKSEINSYFNRFGNSVAKTGAVFKGINPAAYVGYEATKETVIHSYGKNALPFNVIEIASFDEYTIGADFVTAVLTPGHSYKLCKLADVYLKAGTYYFGFDCFANGLNVFNNGINKFGVAYIYKRNDDGSQTLVHACAAYDKKCHTIALNDDGFYSVYPYFVINKEITEDTTVKMCNMFISETETTYHEYFGEMVSQTTKGFLSGFHDMNIVSNSDITITYADIPTNDATNKIVCWGDSLTMGTGCANNKPETDSNEDCSYPAVLGRIIGSAFDVKNFGVGGETSWQIASRQGGMAVNVLPFTIPGESVPVRIYLHGQEQNFFYNSESKKWTFSEANLSYNFDVSDRSGVNPCKIGGIEGTISRVRLSSGETDPETGEFVKSNTYAYYFTRAEVGDKTTFSTPQQMIPYASEAYKNAVHIIWMGQNDAPAHDGKYIMQIGLEDRMQDMINNIDSDKYIVIDYPSGTNETSAERNQIFNQKFGKHYLNIREHIAKYGVAVSNAIGANITISDDDSKKIARGEIPSCLLSDSVHGNYWYYQVVARAINDKGEALGYW